MPRPDIGNLGLDDPFHKGNISPATGLGGDMEVKDMSQGNTKEKDGQREKKIDDAIDKTFPASDPPASGRSTSTEAPARPADRKAPVITKEEIEDARKGKGHKQNDSASG